MENEMGNNNTTGFKEEDSTIDEVKRESVEPVKSASFDDGRNGVATGSHVAADGGPELTGEARVQDLTSGAKDTEIHSIAEDSNIRSDLSSNETEDHSDQKAESSSDNITPEASQNQSVNEDSLRIDSLICADTEIHSIAQDSTIRSDSSSNEPEDHCEKAESGSDNITSEARNDQSVNQDSLRIAEGEEICQSEFVAVLFNVQETIDPFQSSNDQEELSQIYTDPLLDTNTNPSSESNNVLDTNGTSNSEENAHQLVETCEPSKRDNNSASVVELDETKKNDDWLQQLAATEGVSSYRDESEDRILIANGFSAEREMPSDSPSEIGKSSTEPEKTLESRTPISGSEVLTPQDNCMVLTEESDLIRNELGNGEVQLSDDHISEASISESEVDEVNVLKSHSSILTNNHCEQNGAVLGNPAEPDVSGVRQIDEMSYPESAFSIIMSNRDKRTGSEEYSEGSEGKTSIVPEPGEAELSFTERENKDKKPRNYEHKEEEIIEKLTIQEININEQVTLQSLPFQEESYPLQDPEVLPQQQNQQESEIGIESVQCSSISIPELNPDSCEEQIRTSASTFHTRNLTVDNLVVIVDTETEAPREEAVNYTSARENVVAETKPSPPENQVTNRQSNPEVSIFASSNNQAYGYMGRLSIESNPENSNIHPKIQKSSSFDFNLRRNSRSEESDRTPLLYQDKTTIHQLSHRREELLQDHETSRDEKSAILERSDPEKSRTPFLSVTNETKQIHATKKDNNLAGKEAAGEEDESDSPKGKEKMKRRSSFFGTCMCCATVIN